MTANTLYDLIVSIFEYEQHEFDSIVSNDTYVIFDSRSVIVMQSLELTGYSENDGSVLQN